MAHRADESPAIAGDDKLPLELGSQQHVQAQPNFPGVASRAPEEDYPVERVEAVYRKLDLRIIPGLPRPPLGQIECV